MDYTLTPHNVETQLAAIRARAHAVTDGLDGTALNWQPREGRAWSIAQCLHHLALTSDLYADALEAAIAQASARAATTPMRPNLLGRWFIWVIEPPNVVKAPARKDLMPPSEFGVAAVRCHFESSLDRLAQIATRAMAVDAEQARYKNPLANGSTLFNVVTGVMVMLAHNRRHLGQAERVRAGLP